MSCETIYINVKINKVMLLYERIYKTLEENTPHLE